MTQPFLNQYLQESSWQTLCRKYLLLLQRKRMVAIGNYLVYFQLNSSAAAYSNLLFILIRNIFALLIKRLTNNLQACMASFKLLGPKFQDIVGDFPPAEMFCHYRVSTFDFHFSHLRFRPQFLPREPDSISCRQRSSVTTVNRKRENLFRERQLRFTGNLVIQLCHKSVIELNPLQLIVPYMERRELGALKVKIIRA